VGGNDELVIRRVLGQGEPLGIGGRVGVGAIGRHHQVTVSVVAAGGAHGVHKSLVQLVDAARHLLAELIVAVEPPLLVGALGPGLVHGFKNQVLVIILEALRQLLPDGGDVLFSGVVVFVGGVEVALLVIVMDVEDHIHITLDGPVHHFLHAVQPGGVDGEISVHMVVPAHRQAQGVEAGLVHRLDHLFGGFHAAPVAFDGQVITRKTIAGSIEGVAQVPADLHFLHKGHGLVFGDGILIDVLDLGNRHFFRMGEGKRHAGQQKHCQDLFDHVDISFC